MALSIKGKIIQFHRLYGQTLISVRDARILIIFELFGTKEQYDKRLEQMEIRHYNRQKDIDRYYRYEDLWETKTKVVK
ncbi:unnamed protein product [marine sediment metagenome]|uniref:Uncharacterized protein n=1 Tax=marine sediment metagenome TaxID=412755 RepID=X1V6C9_9ZZZZ